MENFTAAPKLKQNTPGFPLEVAGEHSKGNSEKSTLSYATEDVQTSNTATAYFVRLEKFLWLGFYFNSVCQFLLEHQF